MSRVGHSVRIKELPQATHEIPPTSPAFRAIARYYMYEFVHAIQDGPLKDEFLQSQSESDVEPLSGKHTLHSRKQNDT